MKNWSALLLSSLDFADCNQRKHPPVISDDVYCNDVYAWPEYSFKSCSRSLIFISFFVFHLNIKFTIPVINFLVGIKAGGRETWREYIVYRQGVLGILNWDWTKCTLNDLKWLWFKNMKTIHQMTLTFFLSNLAFRHAIRLFIFCWGHWVV